MKGGKRRDYRKLGAGIACRAILPAGLAALALVCSVPTRAQSKPAQTESTAARSAAAARREIPVGAQSVVSATLGNADRGYRAKASAQGYATENPANHLAAQYAAKGVEIRFQNSNLDFEFQGWGYGKRRVNENKAAIAPVMNANRVEYRRGDLTEWYINGPLGIEQGFTILQPPVTLPDSHNDALDIALRLRGNLSASVEPGRHALTLRDQKGAQALRYGPLLAYDASGRELESWMEVQDGSLQLRVNTADAHYPVVVDPFVQVAQLSVSGGPGYLGTATAISDDGTVVVAGACGYNASSGTCSTTLQGQAYVFVEPTTGWATTLTPTAELTAPDGAPGDDFGSAVAISGDGMTIVVSAPELGEAYVYTAATEGAFTTGNHATAILTPTGGYIGDYFGFSIAIDYNGSTIVAYAYYDAATKESHINLYLRPPSGGWANATENAQLQSSDNGTNFGYSLAISGDSSTIVAGSFEGDTSSTEAYVFVEPTTTGGWSSLSPTVPINETVKLKNSDDTYGGFGYAVAVDRNGGTVVVGALYQTVNGTRFEGEAYIFEANGGWGTNGNPQYETTRLEANDTFASATFGQNVSISDDGSTISVGSDSGGVYLFSEPSGGWPKGSTSPVINSSTNPVKLTPTITTETGDYTSLHGKVSGNAVASGAAGTILVSVPGNNSDVGAVFVYGPPAGTTYANYSPTQVDFGNVVDNVPATQTVTVMNTGSGPLIIQLVIPSADGTVLTVTQSTCNGIVSSPPVYPVTISPTGSCAFTVQFDPTAPGAVNVQLGFEDNAGVGESNLSSTQSGPNFLQSMPLSGTGVAPPIATYSPTTLSFGNVTVNTSATQTVQLTNTGAGPLVLQLVGWVGGVAAGFSNTQIQCDYYGILTSLPAGGLTLSPGSSCFFTVQFDPPAAGGFPGGFVIEDNAGPGQSNLPSTAVGNSTSVFAQVVSVSGTGVALGPPPPVVTDNEMITVTDTVTFADVPVNETITVNDAVTVIPLINFAGPAASFSTGSLGFNGISGGTQTLTVSNVGEASLVFSLAPVISSGSFTITQTACSNGATSLPTSLPTAGMCTFTISYIPLAGAAATGTIIFTDNAALSSPPSTLAGPNYRQTISLSGTGSGTGPLLPPSATVTILDNEVITVTDTPVFPDVPDSETITVTDTPTVTNLSHPTTIGVTASAADVATGSPVTFTATVSSTFPGTPTGTVTFLNGQTIISQVALSGTSGVVTTLPLTSFFSGLNIITASYSGDANFLGSMTTSPVIVSVGTPDFTITATPSSLTLAAGQSGSSVIKVTANIYGFPSVITLSCGNPPTYITCTFTPTDTVTLIGELSTSITLTIGVAPSVLSAKLEPHGPTRFGSIKPGPITLAMMAPLGLLGLLPFVGKNRRRLRLYLGIVALTLTVAGALTGCTSAGTGGLTNTNLPPAGTQTIVVNATANGGIAHPLNLIINITN